MKKASYIISKTTYSNRSRITRNHTRIGIYAEMSAHFENRPVIAAHRSPASNANQWRKRNFIKLSLAFVEERNWHLEAQKCYAQISILSHDDIIGVVLILIALHARAVKHGGENLVSYKWLSPFLFLKICIANVKWRAPWKFTKMKSMSALISKYRAWEKIMLELFPRPISCYDASMRNDFGLRCGLILEAFEATRLKAKRAESAAARLIMKKIMYARRP